MARPIESKKFSFIREDAQKVARGALIAGAGAALVYLLQYLMGQDFGEATPAIVALLSVLLNALRKWISENKYPST